MSTIGSCAWGIGTFGLFALFAACNLYQFRRMCPEFSQKWQTYAGLSCVLSFDRVGFLGLDSFRSTLIFLDDETSMGLTTSLTGGLTVSLTISLTEGSEEDEGTKFVEWGVDTEMLST